MIKRVMIFSLVFVFMVPFTSVVKGYNNYEIGDSVKYNDIDYYVIKDNDISITLLKQTPLTTAEVNEYGAGHVNMYACALSDSSCYQKAYDQNGYGGMAYYLSTTCGYDENNNWQESGCKNDYASSEIKYVVDAWKTAKAPAATQARLLTYDELIENAEKKQICTGSCYEGEGLKYDWLYDNNYWYWTMSPYEDSDSSVWLVYSDGSLHFNYEYYIFGVVRPVINLKKEALEKSDETKTDETIKQDIDNDNLNIKTSFYEVPDTLKQVSQIIAVIGIILILIAVYIFVRNITKNKE